MVKKIFSQNFDIGEFAVFNDRPEFSFTEVKQVHGKEILTNPFQNHSEADGMIYVEPPFSKMAIKTADCLPVLILGQKGISLLHAGWRGVHQDITAHSNIKKLLPLTFFLGPSIRHCCYQVGKEFLNYFPHHVEKTAKGLYFDMQAEISRRIKTLYPEAKIVDAKICTCCNEDFHSYRRNKTEKRNFNLFIPKENN